MARTLAQLKTICQYHGWQDQTTTGLAEETNFINETLQILSTLERWPEYCKIDGKVSCAATAATIAAISNDGSTATVTAATHGFVVGDIIDITDTGAATWNLTDVEVLTTADANTFTFATTVTTADPGAGTATKQIDNTALANTRIWRIGSVIRTDWSVPLDEITHDEWIRLHRYHAGTGKPTQYSLQRYVDDTNNAVKTRLLLYPEPTATQTMYYTYQVYPKWLSSDSDITDWPDTRLHLLTQALRIRLSAQDRDTGGVALYSSEFRMMVEKAMAFARPSNRPFIANRSTARDWKTNIQNIEKTFTD